MGENMTFNFECQWLHWFRPGGFNWVNFTFIHADFEWGRSLGDVGFGLGLLGFVFDWSHNYDPDTKLREQLKFDITSLCSVVMVPREEYEAFKAYRAQLNPPKSDTGD